MHESTSPPSRTAARAEARSGAADVNLLSVCYHNLAVEQEYLHQSPSALRSYRRSLQLARIGSAPLAQQMGQTYTRAVDRSFRFRRQTTADITAHALVSLPRARCKVWHRHLYAF